MAYSNTKLTIDNIDNHLDETAELHNGIGASIAHTLVKTGVNVANLARALGTRPETASKYWKLLRAKQIK